MTSKLYNPTTAACLLVNARTGKPGISRQRVIELCKAGRLGQRAGKAWVITQDEIEQFNSQVRPIHRPKAP